MNKINQIFTPRVAKNILDVPLLEDVKEDCVAWKEESKRVYGVKTQYKLLRGIQQETGVAESKGIGVVFGGFVPHLRLTTCYGGFNMTVSLL